MAEGKILPVKTVLSHVKKCKSEQCNSLNTDSTAGPEEAIFEASECFFVEVLQRLEFSSSVTPQQALPSTSKYTLYEVCFWWNLFTPMSEINHLHEIYPPSTQAWSPVEDFLYSLTSQNRPNLFSLERTLIWYTTMFPLQTWQTGTRRGTWEMCLCQSRTHFFVFQKCLILIYI